MYGKIHADFPSKANDVTKLVATWQADVKLPAVDKRDLLAVGKRRYSSRHLWQVT